MKSQTNSSLSFDNGSRTGYSVKTSGPVLPGGFYPKPDEIEKRGPDNT